MHKKKKLMFVLPSMRGGGSERVISILLKHLRREKYDLSLVLLQKEGKYLSDIPKDITLYDLKSKKVRYSIFKLVSLIKQKNPDMVFSTLGHMNLMLSILRPWLPKKIKFIARESNTVSIKNKYVQYPRLFNFLYKKFYNNFDLIICQSNFMKMDLIKNYFIDENKIEVINNPVEINKINTLAYGDKPDFMNGKINFLSVGRLNHQKGYDLLLKAISEIKNIDFLLTILGEGHEKKNLLYLVEKYNIQDKVKFIGFQKNPYLYMKHADLFILSSRYEGFPNVVLEANTCGTPVVAFDCPGGTKEIIQNGLNGYLCTCKNVHELADVIIKSLDYNFDKNAIKKYTKDNYDVSIIVNQYEDVLS